MLFYHLRDYVYTYLDRDRAPLGQHHLDPEIGKCMSHFSTTNVYVVSPSIQFGHSHSSPRVISKLRRRASVPNFKLRVYHRNPYVDHKRKNPLNRNIFLGVACVLRPPIGATAERPTAGTSYGRCGAAGTRAAAGCCRDQPPAQHSHVGHAWQC